MVDYLIIRSVPELPRYVLILFTTYRPKDPFPVLGDGDGREGDTQESHGDIGQGQGEGEDRGYGPLMPHFHHQEYLRDWIRMISIITIGWDSTLMFSKFISGPAADKSICNLIKVLWRLYVCFQRE